MNCSSSSSSSSAASHLIWIDLEMTGLNPVHDRILELAIVVTDSQLQVIAEAPVIALKQSDAVLSAMDSWNKQHHGQSGLLERVRLSQITEAQAQEQLLAFLKRYVVPGSSPMCGNTICQDRRFLVNYMPELERYFHYRNLDVTTLKILANLWAPTIAAGLIKKSTHTALADVYDSIQELAYYRRHLLVPVLSNDF